MLNVSLQIEDESAITKSIRFTAALVLRNFLETSPLTRTWVHGRNHIIHEFTYLHLEIYALQLYCECFIQLSIVNLDIFLRMSLS